MTNIGIDMVKIKRFESFIDEQKKYSRILSPQEIEVFLKIDAKSRKLEYLAGRFAAKEAIIKATSKTKISFNYSELSILNDDQGCPYLESEVFGNYEVLISISHTDEDAVAIVILK